MKSRLGPAMLIKGKAGYYRIGKFLGSGAQGEVFEATLNDIKYAIKWYYPRAACDLQKQQIEYLTAIGPPNRHFLWPLEVLTVPGIQGFGYVMNLRKKNHYPLVDVMKRKIEPSFKSLIKASLILIESFEMLHNKGLSYRDISFGNVFIEPVTGDILICDNDNITYDKDGLKNVLGTPRFMAPEIVRGENYPDIDSDRFSLGILLFYMFMLHHPFEGKLEDNIKCFDLPAMKKLYGENPIFIFHPMNTSNRPVMPRHQNAIVFWKLYPKFFQDMFTKLFTLGVYDKKARPREYEWKLALQRLLDNMVYCKCGAENFATFDSNYSMRHMNCWSCGSKMVRPYRLMVNSNIIVLNYNTAIYTHQITDTTRVDFNNIKARVNPHPGKQGVWGLKNMSDAPWQVLKKSGESRFIAPGYSIQIEDGLMIDFQSCKGRIIL